MSDVIKSSSVEENIKCNMCERFKIRPRTLECLHSFCTQCLQIYLNEFYGLLRSDHYFPCPKCNTKIFVPLSAPTETLAQSFPIDFRITQLITLWKLKKKLISKKL
ncbi:hypothetical protein Ahia01_001400800 [Argonauta hians]